MLVIVTLLSTVLVQAPLAAQTASGDLEKAVQGYWDHLVRGEKSQAMAFVAPETHPQYLARHEPPFRSWSLKAVERSDGRATVTVVVKRLIQDGFYNWTVREEWVLSEDGWRVMVADQGAARKKLWQMHTPVEPVKGQLDLRPTDVRMHFFSGTQKATVYVRNGLSDSIEVTALEYDRERFELEESPRRIDPMSVVGYTLRYRGDETAKGLQSKLVLKVRTPSDDESVFTVPITYNVISGAARVLLGLSRSDAAELKKKDKVTPRRVPPPGRP
ncbi:MAG TPA: hypothetical protein VLV83_23420 [Acidobacteriota bacterium]|nr:hypothetical protein [Acidobacteriota bacterium]